ncbi:helix-turn-helix transcriptional regulator [Bacillus sp. RG28]|uniref:Helix-turn-helix transcriptional regulator n=1 Tax=Gottfriedia endophytica TaxID=2820819 RepID=A0A940NMZ3_9BACI|nr:helix-turn-helix transcriptional regulator [Gottfriedia endophytica]MBP0725571.1 helix-turn-helix transcriptional regulator [Gottfriedia endophytica]
MKDWLKEKRLKFGYTREEISRLAEISVSYYGEIERGEKIPSWKVAKRISNILDFDMILFFY